ncbi:MAG: hypothetical protein LWW97_10985, partial [Deltaproteobacteria bacterium]|nr:hypothetical protein [Deltaproteobacteria bacterium]
RVRVSSGTLAFAYTLPPFWLMTGLSPVSYRPCRSHVKSGFNRFCKTMKRAAPRIQAMTLKRLFEDAQSSVLNELSPGYIEVLQHSFYQLFQDYLEHNKKKDIVRKMIESLDRLREKDPNIPTPTLGVISTKNLARLLGET